MKATSIAHANIALVKYWGKREAQLNLPAVGSISITLDALTTKTTVRFSDEIEADRFVLNGASEAQKAARVFDFLDHIRAMADIRLRAEVLSENNFPTGSGLASSASGFAALALAASSAAGLSLSSGQLSILARQGSGSAARSIFGGFVEMYRGNCVDGSDSFAMPLAAGSHWPLGVLICVTDPQEKSIGSTKGMNATAETSPYYGDWIQSSPVDLSEMRSAIEQRDFEKLAGITERSCLKMHGLMLSADPGLLYWNAVTVELIHHVRALRASGLPVCFTIDAGPQVKIICPQEVMDDVRQSLVGISGVHDVFTSGLGGDAALLEEDVASSTSAA